MYIEIDIYIYMKRERERSEVQKREGESLFVCERKTRGTQERERERERECVCVRERERERDPRYSGGDHAASRVEKAPPVSRDECVPKLYGGGSAVNGSKGYGIHRPAIQMLPRRGSISGRLT